jgi:hypothetical protein
MRKIKEQKALEILYLPKGEFLKYIALDHRLAFADLLWLQFIQYYGYHLQTDRKYPYMFSILDVLTDLDPKFKYAYTFGSILLAYDAKDKEKAERLIRKGMYRNPDRYEYPWWYGFLCYVRFKEYDKAGRYFRLASLKPNAPDMAYRWAAFVYYMKLRDLETALKLWYVAYENAKSEFEKALAEYYIKATIMRIHLRDLQKIINYFVEKEGYVPKTLNELVLKGYLKEIPEHPFKGEYYYIRNGKVYSSKRFLKD